MDHVRVTNEDRNKGGGDGRKVPGAYYGKRATVPKFLRGIGMRLEMTFSRQPPPSTEPTEEEEDAPAASSVGLSSTGNQCFATRNELKAAVDVYVKSDCNEGASANVCPDITSKYGWPMNSWCVGKVTDMSSLFYEMSTFNEDISSWDVSQVQDMSYMFYDASLFNQNLCSWAYKNFPYNNAAYIFFGSGCTYQSTPLIVIGQ